MAKREGERQRIVDVCKQLYAKDWLAACDGNVSWRLSDEEILITPSARHKGFISAQDIAVIDINNNILSGTASGERLMHLEVYKACPQATCVVHAHPPIATAWSVGQPQLRELPAKCLSEVILAVGRIPIVPYARPGTLDMGTHLRPFLPQCRVMILARHGALAWGQDMDEAFYGIERLEHSAKTLMYAKLLGGLSELAAEDVEKLQHMRESGDQRTL